MSCLFSFSKIIIFIVIALRNFTSRRSSYAEDTLLWIINITVHKTRLKNKLTLQKYKDCLSMQICPFWHPASYVKATLPCFWSFFMGYLRPRELSTNRYDLFGSQTTVAAFLGFNKSARAASFDCQNTRRSFCRLKNDRAPKAQCSAPHDLRKKLLHEFFKTLPQRIWYESQSNNVKDSSLDKLPVESSLN